MTKERKIEILIQLGSFFRDSISETDLNSNHPLSAEFIEDFQNRILRAKHENAWFSEDSIKMAISAWGKALQKEHVEAWLNAYDFSDQELKTGLIMAGNIPMVGLHDALSVLVSNHHLIAKLSSKDHLLMEAVLMAIGEIAPEWKGKIHLNQSMKGLDNLIATGSDNSARYFDHYFKEVKRIIRKNRTSVAVLNGEESQEDLENLALDIFTHFGLGCRNVTKVFLPRGYDLDKLFAAFYAYKEIAEHNKYANNYDYNKAVYLLNKIDLLENGFLLMKEDEGLHSPVSVLFYTYYEDLAQLKQELKALDSQIQCIVSNVTEFNPVPFGKAQSPALTDYADGLDTLKFLGQQIKV